MKKISEKVKFYLLSALAALVIALCIPLAAMPVQAASFSQGIDVSGFQGNIDWQKVKNSGVQFAMIRLGNTKYGLDSKYIQNMTGAAAAGIRTGVYVYSYATNAAEAVADAQLAVTMMSPFSVSFPVAFDFEDSSQATLTHAQQIEIINAFCSVIYNAGYTPIVYSYGSWFLNKFPDLGWDRWVAEYGDRTSVPATCIWQYTSSGRVAGISGNVDMDYGMKDYYSSITADGLVERDGACYYFQNYRRQVGMQTINGIQYFFGVDGKMVKNSTITDGAGNIIRMCKDGHVVIITAAAQQQAALLQAAYEQATAQEAQAELIYEQICEQLSETIDPGIAAALQTQATVQLQQIQNLQINVQSAAAQAAAAQAAVVIPD